MASTLFTLAIFNLHFRLFDSPSISFPDYLERLLLLLYLLWLSLILLLVYPVYFSVWFSILKLCQFGILFFRLLSLIILHIPVHKRFIFNLFFFVQNSVTLKFINSLGILFQRVHPPLGYHCCTIVRLPAYRLYNAINSPI